MELDLIHRLGEVGVDHGRRDVRVAHELLDRGQVDPGHDQVAGEGVAEGMEPSNFTLTD
ncbi:MAG TPA: hypothetical protein PKW75_07065 [candidate division Zixibacteria bacterium]|nr:hypothetical protein [candidate division Zixibacteria bacterium]